MGLLTATFGGVVIPVKITKLNRNLTPAVSNQTRSLGNGDGVELVYSRREEKRISFDYIIDNHLAKDLSDFRRKTAGILNSKVKKELIFSDEPALYYDAILDGEQSLEEEFLSSSGTLTFLVPDGLAHSKVEKTFSAVSTNGILEATIVNNGTEAVPIDYTIKHNHENGYIGIVSEHGVIQLGSADEVDKETLQKSQVLVNYRKAADYNAMTNGQGVLTENFPKNGTWATFYDYLALGNAGSGSNWHGASKMLTLPADSNGEVGAANFRAETQIWYETGRVPETGLLEFVLGDENGQHLASIHIVKSSTNKNQASAIMLIQLQEMKRIIYEPNYKSVTIQNRGQMYIQKSGELFDFYFGGKNYQFRIPALAAKKAKTITVFLGQFGSRGTGTLVTRMYFGYLTFRKDNVSYLRDIPNRYAGGSTVFVDGSASKVYVNGILSMDDERVGSKYFEAPPGETKVQFYYSGFSTPPPTITAKIREAYL